MALKNSIINFDQRAIVDDPSNIKKSTDFNNTNTLSVNIYSREKILKIRELIDRVSKTDWIAFKQVSNNMTLEKISLDIYGTSKYWDVLLMLNRRMPIFDMPYEYDVISEIGETTLKHYEKKIYKGKLNNKRLPNGKSTRQMFKESFEANASNDNEKFRIIKYIIPHKIYDFINLCYQRQIIL